MEIKKEELVIKVIKINHFINQKLIIIIMMGWCNSSVGTFKCQSVRTALTAKNFINLQKGIFYGGYSKQLKFQTTKFHDFAY
jgi:hypothetical protein